VLTASESRPAVRVAAGRFSFLHQVPSA
jgi:hypothetical protein